MSTPCAECIDARVHVSHLRRISINPLFFGCTSSTAAENATAVGTTALASPTAVRPSHHSYG